MPADPWAVGVKLLEKYLTNFVGCRAFFWGGGGSHNKDSKIAWSILRSAIRGNYHVSDGQNSLH